MAMNRSGGNKRTFPHDHRINYYQNNNNKFDSNKNDNWVKKS